MNDRQDIDIKSLKAKLLSERKALVNDAKASEKSRQAVTLDQSSVGRLSRMDALQIQAMQVETERRRAVEITRIGTALKRIDSGDYGYCVACGEDIAAKRLNMSPAAPTCMNCASK